MEIFLAAIGAASGEIAFGEVGFCTRDTKMN